MSNGGQEPRVLTWLKVLAAVVGVASVIAYGFLRIAYVQFYGHFGAQPEEAGLGKTELLSQALVGPVVLILVAIIVTLALLLLAFVYYLLNTTADVSVWTSLGRRFKQLMYVSIVIATVFTGYKLMFFAKDSADDVLNNRSSLNTRHVGFHGYLLPLLEVRAIPAKVEWIGAKDDAPKAIKRARKCLMLLGQTDDQVLLYDFSHRLTLHLPKDNVSVEVRSTQESLPDSCAPPAESAP